MPKSYSETLGFLGQHNKARSRRQPKGDGHLISLADSQNVNIDDEGSISSRDGQTLALNGINIVGGFSLENNLKIYIADNGSLIEIEGDIKNTRVLGAVSTQPVEWLEVGTQVFMSTGYIIDNDVLIPWATPIPALPTVIVTSGFLLAGQYQLTLTTIMPDGRESGSCEIIALNLPDNSGLTLSGVNGCMVYMTELNGSVFYEIGIGVAVIDSLSVLTNKSINNDLIIGNTFPDGVEKIAFYNECLYCSIYDATINKSTLFWSKPFLFHVFNYFEDVEQIIGEVRLIYGTPEYLLIGTDRAIFSFNDNGLVKLAGYGVIKGKSLKKNRDGTVMIQSLRGVCTLPFQNLTGDKLTVPLGGLGTTAFVEQSGTEHFITITDGTGQSSDNTDF